MSSKNEPCPFCGSNNLQPVTYEGIHYTQCKDCEATGPTEFKRGEACAVVWNTRAAPVVERQPVAIVDEGDEGLFIDFIYGEDGNPLRRGDILYAAPPELAELQATIARLRIDLSNQSELTNQANYHKTQRTEALNDEIARLTAENERIAGLVEVLRIASGSIREICHVRNISPPNSTLRRIDAALKPYVGYYFKKD